MIHAYFCYNLDGYESIITRDEVQRLVVRRLARTEWW